MLSSGNAQLSLCRFFSSQENERFLTHWRIKNNDNEMIFHYKPGLVLAFCRVGARVRLED